MGVLKELPAPLALIRNDCKGTLLELTPGWRSVTEQGWSGTSGLIPALNKMARAVLKHR